MRIRNGGQEWTSTFKDWNAAGYQAPLLYVSPHDPSVVFAGGETSIFQPYPLRSSDFGEEWERTVHARGPTPAAIRTLLLAEQNDEEYVYLGTTEGVYVYAP